MQYFSPPVASDFPLGQKNYEVQTSCHKSSFSWSNHCSSANEQNEEEMVGIQLDCSPQSQLQYSPSSSSPCYSQQSYSSSFPLESPFSRIASECVISGDSFVDSMDLTENTVHKKRPSLQPKLSRNHTHNKEDVYIPPPPSLMFPSPPSALMLMSSSPLFGAALAKEGEVLRDVPSNVDIAIESHGGRVHAAPRDQRKVFHSRRESASYMSANNVKPSAHLLIRPTGNFDPTCTYQETSRGQSNTTSQNCLHDYSEFKVSRMSPCLSNDNNTPPYCANDSCEAINGHAPRDSNERQTSAVEAAAQSIDHDAMNVTADIIKTRPRRFQQLIKTFSRSPLNPANSLFHRSDSNLSESSSVNYRTPDHTQNMLRMNLAERQEEQKNDLLLPQLGTNSTPRGHRVTNLCLNSVEASNGCILSSEMTILDDQLPIRFVRTPVRKSSAITESRAGADGVGCEAKRDSSMVGRFGSVTNACRAPPRCDIEKFLSPTSRRG